MMKLSCFLTGEDYDFVRTETPASRKKIAALATALLIPVTTWFVIGYTVSSSLFGLPTITSVFTGLATGSLILVIERTILMSGKSKGLLWLRIILGLLIATLGAVMIDEIIFREDIDSQVFQERRELMEAEKVRIQSEYGSPINEARLRVSTAYDKWVNSLADARKESDGSGGSGIRGVHSIAKLKLDIARQHEQDYQLAKTELAQLEQKFESSVQSGMTALGNSITGHSILFRIKALFKLVVSDGWVLAIYLLFTFLVGIMEFVVIILKYAADETHYDKRVEAMEQVGKRRLLTIIDRDHQFYDPAAQTEPVLRAERTLRQDPPRLFRSGSRTA